MARRPRIAIISDTVDDTNGVAIGLRRLAAAATRSGRHIALVGPAVSQAGDDGTVVRIPTTASASLPFYPGMIWSAPDVSALVAYLRESIDLVQCSTPGPMGVAGLFAARALGLPVVAQYHTEVAEYATLLTGFPMLRGILEPVVGWFYQQADLCLAPSGAVVRRLETLGVPAERIRRVPRGVDLDLFHPRHCDRQALARFGVAEGPVALYVGRLSTEKNLSALRAAWIVVHGVRPDAHLLVVGEGPNPALIRGPGIVHTGPLFETELAHVFASADVFAFPSETETFGNVVVEAAASGLPAVVTNVGAACEHVVHGITGEVVTAGDTTGLAGAIVGLFDDQVRRAGMGAAARQLARRYDARRALDSTCQIYEEVAP